QKLATGVAAETDDDLIYMMSKVQENLTSYQPGDLILTDDKAPVELLGMQIIDELIAGVVGYYKDIYKTQGLEGLINML
ncbi:MAG: spermidine synthase, partial [Alphaproteobacteria bacterium]|nr:spermidine synthase [Alphaproteobacteria bacterium]